MCLSRSSVFLLFPLAYSHLLPLVDFIEQIKKFNETIFTVLLPPRLYSSAVPHDSLKLINYT